MMSQRKRQVALLALLIVLGLGAAYKSNCWYGYETPFCVGVDMNVGSVIRYSDYLFNAYWDGLLGRNGSAVVTPGEAVISFPHVDSSLQGYHVRIECPLEPIEWPGYTLPERCGDYWSYRWLVFVKSPMDKIADRFRLPMPRGSGEMDGFLLKAELEPDSALGPGEGELAVAMRSVRADVDEICCHAGTFDSLPGANVTSSLEDGRVVVRLKGRELVERVFGQRRHWVLLSWPTAEAVNGDDGWVWVTYHR